MSSETTIVATQVRLHQWMDQIRECQNLHIAKLIGRVCGAKRPHSVSEQPIYIVSL